MRLKCLVLAVLMLAAMLGGCGRMTADTLTPEETSVEIGTAREPAETEQVRYVYKTRYADFAFVTDGQRQTWLEPLTSLLNNEERMVFDKGGDHLYDEILYPDRPCVARGYELALFDFNTDGTPELLVNTGGGSAGNAYYYVYDIMTGEKLGELNGGHDDSWCIYFNRALGRYEAIGHFGWRYGWMGRSRMVNRAAIGKGVSNGEARLHESSLMHAYYEIDAVILDAPQEEADKQYAGDWRDVYTGAEFSVDGDSATIEEYFAAEDGFRESYTRIAETGIRLISWRDVTEDGDDVATRARKMAEALVFSEQQFVVGLSFEDAES